MAEYSVVFTSSLNGENLEVIAFYTEHLGYLHYCMEGKKGSIF